MSLFGGCARSFGEHAASEAIRRAAAARSRPMKTFEPGSFSYRHNPGKRAETALRGRYLGPAALIGPHGRSCWWVRFGGRAYLCATEHLRGVTLDESDRLGINERRQLDELLKAAQEVPETFEDLTSQPGPPPSVEVPTEPEEPSRDDLDIGMEAAEQMTLLEEARETESSTEIGEQSTLWKERGTNHGQQASAEILDEETGGSSQFVRARLEETLDNEPEKMGDDDTSRISPAETLMTKNSWRPTTSTRTSV